MPPRTNHPKRQKRNNRNSSNSTPVSQLDGTNDDESVINKATCTSEQSSKDVPEDTEDSQLQKSIHDIGQEFICACCMDVMIEPTTIVPCGHTFCNQCIFRSIEGSKEVCPNCRTDIVATVPNRSVGNAIRSIILLQEKQLQSKQPSCLAPKQSNSRSRTRSTSAQSTVIAPPTASTSTTITSVKKPTVSFFLPDDVKSFRSRETSAPPSRQFCLSLLGYDEITEADTNNDADDDTDTDARTGAEAAINDIVDFYQRANATGSRVSGNNQRANAASLRSHGNNQRANTRALRTSGNYQQDQERRRRRNLTNNAISTNPLDRFSGALFASSSSSSDSSSSDEDEDEIVASPRVRLYRAATRTTAVSTTTTTINRQPSVRVRSDRVLRSASRTRRGRTRLL